VLTDLVYHFCMQALTLPLPAVTIPDPLTPSDGLILGAGLKLPETVLDPNYAIGYYFSVISVTVWLSDFLTI
jgi:hypothetical protein